LRLQVNFVVYEPTPARHVMAPGGIAVPAHTFWPKWARWLGVEYARAHLSPCPPVPPEPGRSGHPSRRPR
jgi:hypothetical protein